MPRLVLAVLVIVCLAALATCAIAGISRGMRALGPNRDRQWGEQTVQKTAYLLLIALILYVSVTGGI